MKAPRMYAETLRTVRKQVKGEHNREPTLRELKTEMVSLWKSVYGRNRSSKVEYSLLNGFDEDEDDDKSADEPPKQYGKKSKSNSEKRCYECGKVGHIKRDCPKNKKCGHCGKKGHNDTNCWKKHPEKQPKWMKNKRAEVAALSMDRELVLSRIDYCLPCNCSEAGRHGGCAVNDREFGLQTEEFPNNEEPQEEFGQASANPVGQRRKRTKKTGKCKRQNQFKRGPSNKQSGRRTQNRKSYGQRSQKQRKVRESNCCDSRAHTRHACQSVGPRRQVQLNRNGWYRAPKHTYTRPKIGVITQVRENTDKEGNVESWSINVKPVSANSPGGFRINMNKYVNNAHVCAVQTRNTYIMDAENTVTGSTRPLEPDCVLLNVGTDTALSALEESPAQESLFSPSIWIADTGATCHVTNSRAGSTPSKNANARLRNANHSLDASGNSMQATAIVDIRGVAHNSTGRATPIRITDCRYGGSKFNLCSINKLTDNGWTMVGDRTGIHLQKGEQALHFDIPIATREGKLWAVWIERQQSTGGEELNLATASTTMPQRLAHEYCGHAGMASTRETAKHLGWTLNKDPHKCESCAKGKSRQVDLGAGDKTEVAEIGELWYVDGMSLKEPRRTMAPVVFPHNNCLVMGVEHLTGATIFGWYPNKSRFTEDFCMRLQRFKKAGMRVKRVRCDDAGENMKFRKALNGKHWRMGVAFEYTAKTPQRNSRVETKLYHISGKTRASLDAANVPKRYRHVLFTHFFKWCCQTDMLTVLEVHGERKTRHEHMFGGLPKWMGHMQVAGMAGVVKTHTRTTSKVDARGKTCMFVCYAENHARDCYVMYDPETKSILHSRDVQWLGRMYFAPSAKVQQELTEEASVESESDGESTTEASVEASIETEVVDFESDQPLFEQESVSEPDESEDEEDEQRVRTRTRSGRRVRAPIAHDGTELAALAIQDGYAAETCLLGMAEARISALEEVYDVDMLEEEYVLFSLTKQEKIYQSVEYAFGYIDSTKQHRLVAAALMDTSGELFLVGATGENYGNTEELNVMNYKQAMQTVDRKEWEKAIKVEHDKMVKYNVFEVVNYKDVPAGTKLFDSTWAMKKKPNGVFRARNAFRGFQQEDGKHYDSHDKSSPVATEVSIRICFVLALSANWYQHLVDVEGAFLNGEFQHPERHQIYMKVPEAYKKWYPSWGVFKLLKTQYGTVQAALQYYRECCKALAFLGFKRNPAEPCVFYKWEQEQLVMFVLWVDDCCISGPKELVLKTVKEFMGLWDCKDLGQLEEYVGCRVEREANYIRLTQPVKVQRFEDEFGCAGGNGPSNKAPTTPAEPGSVLEFDKEADEPLSPTEQTKYRSGVGILLHMMRWSRPDVLNAVRELSSHMQQGSKKSMRALNRVMNFIVSTKKKGFTIKVDKPGKWNGRKGTYKFTISGKCDSEYAKHSSRRSVNAGIVYLEGAIVKQFSRMMPIIALSTTEAELYSAVITAQDMMFVLHIMINMELEVELPMILLCDNKGTVDLANNWSVGGRTRHIDVKQNFLRELKERGFLMVKWRSGLDMTPDMHTKNLSRDLFNRYSSELVS